MKRKSVVYIYIGGIIYVLIMLIYLTMHIHIYNNSTIIQQPKNVYIWIDHLNTSKVPCSKGKGQNGSIICKTESENNFFNLIENNNGIVAIYDVNKHVLSALSSSDNFQESGNVHQLLPKYENIHSMKSTNSENSQKHRNKNQHSRKLKDGRISIHKKLNSKQGIKPSPKQPLTDQYRKPSIADKVEGFSSKCNDVYRLNDFALTSYCNYTLQTSSGSVASFSSSTSYKDLPEVLKNKTYKILVYNAGRNSSHTLGNVWFGMKNGTESFETCSYKNCLITSNITEYNDSDVMMVLMWLAEADFMSSVPQYRPNSEQKWFMFLGEAPEMAATANAVGWWSDYNKFNHMFNATWTYHRSSDIWTNYSTGYFQRKESQWHPPKTSNLARKNYAEGKTKMIAWFTTNCYTKSKRREYVYHLQEYIDVDIYGGCGDLKCDMVNETACIEMLDKKYKFYLAFENSLCEDYITEKLWKIMPNIDIIPVVMGGANYSDILPPNSYIDIGNFNTTQQLAEYLLMLNASDELYNSYFVYRQYYDFLPVEKPACQLCEYVNKNHHIVKIYDQLGHFWDGKRLCKTPETYYKNIPQSTWSYCSLHFFPWKCLCPFSL